ncbi:MAG: Ldh family oxidoreductase [Kiloniellales bacterium]
MPEPASDGLSPAGAVDRAGADSRLVSAADLKAFLARAFLALGVPQKDAGTVAGLMVEADLYGADTHGSFRLQQYKQRLVDGGTNATPKVRVVEDSGATAVVDGDNGLGHLALLFATELAIEKAKRHGIGWVGVRNGNHAGPASLYVRRLLAHDMIGLYAAVGSANHVPPWGGAELLLGTNPLAVAVPGGEEPPFVLDMATTVAAAGKIKTLAQRGESMPEGWMVGRDGKPLTDPNRQKDGLLLPIGGPKGYGLALAIGLLAGVLNGAAFGRNVVDFTADTTSPTNTGQFIAAISLGAFGPVPAFKSAVDRAFRDLRASKTLPGFESVRIPGDRSEEVYRERSASGIPLHPNLLKVLREIAGELKIAPLD